MWGLGTGDPKQCCELADCLSFLHIWTFVPGTEVGVWCQVLFALLVPVSAERCPAIGHSSVLGMGDFLLERGRGEKLRT